MTSTEMAQKLVDSKEFCRAFAKAAAIWSKRQKSEDIRDKVRAAALAPIVRHLVGFFEDAPEAGPERRQPRHEESARLVAEEAKQGIELGQMGGDSGLAIDPFKHPEDQAGATPLPPPKASPEPNMALRLQEHYKMLTDAIEANGPWPYGSKKTFLMPPIWNANEAVRFFQALRTHELAGNGEGVRIAPNQGGWFVTCFKKG